MRNLAVTQAALDYLGSIGFATHPLLLGCESYTIRYAPSPSVESLGIVLRPNINSRPALFSPRPEWELNPRGEAAFLNWDQVIAEIQPAVTSIVEGVKARQQSARKRAAMEAREEAVRRANAQVMVDALRAHGLRFHLNRRTLNGSIDGFRTSVAQVDGYWYLVIEGVKIGKSVAPYTDQVAAKAALFIEALKVCT